MRSIGGGSFPGQRAVARRVEGCGFSHRESMLQWNGYAVNAETPFELLTDCVTLKELFFVRSHWIPRTPDPKKWRLTIDGEVERSMGITLSALKKLPYTETTQ
jgi:DMSO/TMAO reductase YedYZ molybdopterin-dependent catalytic subunit